MDIFSKISVAFEQGGFWMYPILAIQIASIVIIVERAFVLFLKRKEDQTQITTQFEESIRRGDLDATVEKASALQSKSSIARAVLAGAKAARLLGGKDEIQGKMDEVLVRENALLDRRTGFLSTLGNVATLTGLLGTITGMIKSFAAVSFANPSEKAALLAAGISEAMNATAYGLIVAIPALLAYAILQNRANHLAEDLNHSALQAYNWLSFNFETIGLKGGSGKSSQKPEINA